MNDSDTSSIEMDSKPQILKTFNTNEQSGLIVIIKPDHCEFDESRMKQEFVSNKEISPTDAAITNEITEMSFSEEVTNTNGQSEFSTSDANTTIKNYPLATEIYIKQENEVYVSPSFSTFGGSDAVTDHNSLVVDIKPDPFEIDNLVEQENVSNQEIGRSNNAIKYEDSELTVSDTMFFSKEVRNTDKQCHFSTSDASLTVKCDPLATETYVKQENEVYVSPSFSTFGGSDGDTGHSNEKAGFVSVNGYKLKFKNKPAFQCKVCNKTLSRRSDLKNHMLIHTGEKPYHCDVCSKGFTRSSYLNDHKRIHTGEKPFKCDMCDRSFVQSGQLNIHKRLHSGEKPYRCDVCGKRFSRSTLLNIHKRIHTGEKPNRCDICDKSFTQRCSLKIHRRLHTGEKPYRCDLCNKCFAHSHTLTVHKQSHSGERPYRCDVCDQAFIYLYNLHRHKRKHV